MIKLSKNSVIEKGYILMQASKREELSALIEMLHSATYKQSCRHITHDAVYLDLEPGHFHIISGKLSGCFIEIRMEDQKCLTPYCEVFQEIGNIRYASDVK